MTTAAVIWMAATVVALGALWFEAQRSKPLIYDETPEPYEAGSVVICLACGLDRMRGDCQCEEPEAELHYGPEEAA